MDSCGACIRRSSSWVRSANERPTHSSTAAVLRAARLVCLQAFLPRWVGSTGQWTSIRSLGMEEGGARVVGGCLGVVKRVAAARRQDGTSSWGTNEPRQLAQALRSRGQVPRKGSQLKMISFRPVSTGLLPRPFGVHSYVQSIP